ncbi:fibropellin-3-like [Ptychodera flava]|uniref:fibropellin-3-like n=1 Tax=Ptychodera flava TaxID=63121 RepID=UPI00396A6B58
MRDWCLNAPCANGGTCTSTVDGHGCECLPGYNGDSCEQRSTRPDCTKNCIFGSCEIVDGKQACRCNSGFEKWVQGGIETDRCVDINECSIGSHQCSQHCVNFPGSHICLCDLDISRNTME